jgi:ABC-type nitrate/sulfonate/bicarbonate transport system substrate-binding protein
MKTNFTFFLLALVIVGSAPLTGAAQEKVRIGVPLFPTVSFPVFIAQEKGFFEKNGLKAEIIRINSEPTTYQALISGVIIRAPPGCNPICKACRWFHSEVGTTWYRTPWQHGRRSVIYRN